MVLVNTNSSTYGTGAVLTCVDNTSSSSYGTEAVLTCLNDYSTCYKTKTIVTGVDNSGSSTEAIVTGLGNTVLRPTTSPRPSISSLHMGISQPSSVPSETSAPSESSQPSSTPSNSSHPSCITWTHLCWPQSFLPSSCSGTIGR